MPPTNSLSTNGVNQHLLSLAGMEAEDGAVDQLVGLHLEPAAKHFYLGESEDYLLKTGRSEYVSKVRIPMSHLQDPRPMLDAIPGALADAERRIAETTWLRLATRGKEVTLLPNTDGSAYFLEFPGYSDITVRALVLESEEDVLVSNPTRSIVSLVKLQPSKRQTTTLRISPDGSAVFVD